MEELGGQMEPYGLTNDELTRLRALLKLQLLHEKTLPRAFAILGYVLLANLAIYGAILVIVIFFAGIAQLTK